jgi:hypothetical protein
VHDPHPFLVVQDTLLHLLVRILAIISTARSRLASLRLLPSLDLVDDLPVEVI